MRLGDLDALKADFEKRRESCVEWEKKAVKEGNDEIATRALATYDFIGEVIMTINNAPTVPLPDFKEGYKQAIIDGKTNYSRPQGEWIKEDNGKTTDLYRCSICGRSIMLCKNADLSKYPFCHCGADMQKGGAI